MTEKIPTGERENLQHLEHQREKVLKSEANEYGSRVAQDRAAAVTTAVLQVLRDGDIESARAEIEALLRDEFYDNSQETRDEIRLVD